MRRAVSFMAVLLVAATGAAAQGDNKYSRETLRGLNGVSVVVEDLTPEAKGISPCLRCRSGPISRNSQHRFVRP